MKQKEKLSQKANQKQKERKLRHKKTLEERRIEMFDIDDALQEAHYNNEYVRRSLDALYHSILFTFPNLKKEDIVAIVDATISIAVSNGLVSLTDIIYGKDKKTSKKKS